MGKFKELSPSTVYWILAVPLWAIFSWAAFNFQPAIYSFGDDFWEHSAAIHAWTHDLWQPQSPHVASDEGSSRYMPFFFVVTGLSVLFGFTPLQGLGVAGVISISLFMIGVKLFSDRYFRSPWAAPIALLVLLCGWGVSWNWSNSYQLRQIFHGMSYPSFFVFSFGFIAYWWLLGLIKSEALSLPRLIVLALIVGILFSSHPPTGVAIIVTMGLMITFAEHVHLRRRVALLFVLAAGSLLVELWPYFSTWQIVFGTSGGESSTWISRVSPDDLLSRASTLYRENHHFYQPLEVLLTLGPALLGVPMVFYLFVKERNRLLIAGFTIFSIPYLLFIAMPIPLGYRSIFYAIFFLHLSLVYFFLKLIVVRRHPTWLRWTGISLLSVMVLWNVGLAGGELLGFRLNVATLKFKDSYDKPRTTVDYMQTLADVVPRDAVIMAREKLAWPIPTFVGKVVSGLHLNPMIKDAARRRKDVEVFFNADTDFAERQEIIKRYHVTHVLYDPRKLSAEVRADMSVIPGTRMRIHNLTLITLPKEIGRMVPQSVAKVKD